MRRKGHPATSRCFSRRLVNLACVVAALLATAVFVAGNLVLFSTTPSEVVADDHTVNTAAVQPTAGRARAPPWWRPPHPAVQKGGRQGVSGLAEQVAIAEQVAVAALEVRRQLSLASLTWEAALERRRDEGRGLRHQDSRGDGDARPIKTEIHPEDSYYKRKRQTLIHSLDALRKMQRDLERSRTAPTTFKLDLASAAPHRFPTPRPRLPLLRTPMPGPSADHCTAYTASHNPLPVFESSNTVNYANTPMSEHRPHFQYCQRAQTAPAAAGNRNGTPPPSGATLTVITITRNPREVVFQTRDFLDQQSFAPFVWLIIDDHSDDPAARARLRTLARHPKATVLRSPGLPGNPYARNFAIGLVRTKYVAFLDDDDYFELAAYEKLVWTLESMRELQMAGM